jgi:hypothetical protein
MEQMEASVRAVGLVLSLSASLLGCAVAALPGPGKVYLEHWAPTQADDQQVREILVAFDRAEEALQARDLETLMQLYAEDYDHHGITKEGVRQIWWGLLARYRRITSFHIFSGIKVTTVGTQRTAEVICTGRLESISEAAEASVAIDSWFYEVHHLIYTDGAWRIRGHRGEAPTYLRSLGLWPHPFF